jgi:hypothetical protein
MPTDTDRILAAVRAQADRLTVDVQLAVQTMDAAHLFPWNDTLGHPDYRPGPSTLTERA